MEEYKYLKLARQARRENNAEDAKRFYDIIRVENPDDGEAKYFYTFIILLFIFYTRIMLTKIYLVSNITFYFETL